MAEDQTDVFAFLSDPATHGDGSAAVERIDTHISAVFLVGDRAYKVKRAVCLPFVDFATLERRHAACLAEVAVNGRTAPEVYLGVMAVTREADGRLALAGAGAPVEWLVAMMRFDQDDLFDRMAAGGLLTREHAFALADAVASFHEAAEPCPDWGGEKGIRLTIDTNAVCFARHIPGLFDAVLAGRVTEGALARLVELDQFLESRRHGGRVRVCHGDLHLGNIFLSQGHPRIFDAIEFNKDFACIDVFYDLAFLLMDLRARGLAPMASWVLNRYLERTGDLDGLAALPLFLSLRAAIRAHVSAAIAEITDGDERRRDAVRYLEMALGYLSPLPPRLLAVGGLSGSGKSRLARDLAPLVGAAPGAVVLRTDVLRKRLLGVAPETRLRPEGYSAEMTERTYGTLLSEVERALKTGHAVIADAVFALPGQREAVAAVAKKMAVPFDGFWLEADPRIMRERIAARRGNASDATEAVLEAQLSGDPGPIAWHRVDSSGPRDETLALVRKFIAA